MFPEKIYLVRHGEKPGEVGTEKRDDGINLAARGRARAHAIAEHAPELFGISDWSDIDYIFATAPSHASSRPLETIKPLASICGKRVKTKYTDEEFAKLAKKLKGKKYDGKIVVVAWHHGKLPHLIKALGGNTDVAPIKDGKWDENVFDRVIILSASNPKTIVTQSIPQKLLFKDSDT